MLRTFRVIATRAPFAITALVVVLFAADAPAVDAAAPPTKRYVDPLSWSVAYPPTMQLERSAGFLRISVFEVSVASFPMRTAVRTHSTADGGWLRVDPPSNANHVFPADGVGFRIVRREGGPAPDVEAPESHFPLRLSTFRRSTASSSFRPRPLERPVVADGRVYFAQAWIGAKAPASSRATLARVVSSVAFPSLRVGQTVGYGFQVFQRAGHYPVGSFTRVSVRRQPFYLVHAPGGFYAVGWRWQTIAGGYKSRCDLRLDRARRQFFCTNIAARWDRVGRVLTKPKRAAQGDPLNIAVAKIAWERHVLLYPNSARFATAPFAGELWPSWHPSR